MVKRAAGDWLAPFSYLALSAALAGCALFPSLDTLGGVEGGTTDQDGADDHTVGADGRAVDATGGKDGTVPPEAGDVGSEDSDGGEDATPIDAHREDVFEVLGTDAGFACHGHASATCGSSCPGLPQPCMTCDTSGHVAAFCVAGGGSCRSEAPPGFGQSCSCADGGVAECPGPFQVCFESGGKGDFCHTCGEAPTFDGGICKGGGECVGFMCE
jgi:hypothetical protein